MHFVFVLTPTTEGGVVVVHDENYYCPPPTSNSFLAYFLLIPQQRVLFVIDSHSSRVCDGQTNRKTFIMEQLPNRIRKQHKIWKMEWWVLERKNGESEACRGLSCDIIS